MKDKMLRLKADIKEFGAIFVIETRLLFKLKLYKMACKLIKKKLSGICKETYSKDFEFAGCETEEKNIWFFWWQGIENAPEVVKLCYASIVKNSNGYRINLITEKNYDKYVKLPNNILDKFSKGYISITHMSDIIRVHLLRDFGGLWLDACSFVSEPIPTEYMNAQFMSKKALKASEKYVAEGKWAVCLMATKYKKSALFSFVCEAYEEYFSKKNRVIDYFLTDYLISVAYDHISVVRNAIEEIPVNNQNARKLIGVINEPFVEEKWKEICKNTWLHSLTYKKPYYEENCDKPTFYSRIVLNNEN